MAESAPSTTEQSTTLWELARLFLKLGTTAFGGPAAHIAILQQEVVERRGWISEAEFLDHLGASNLIPGPTSTELVIHIGRKRGGGRGLLIAGFCFILPAAVMVGILAWAYVRYGSLPAVSGLLYGVKPVVIAIILQALWKLGRTATKSVWLGIVALVTLFLAVVGVSPLLVLLVGGFLGIVVSLGPNSARPALPAFSGGTLVRSGSLLATSLAGLSPGLLPIFLIFVKMGALVFGSGYVLLVFLHTDLVERHAWLTQQQLLDAVAVGQVTPGPVFTTATFVGYLLHGTSGAIVATIGIFLPAFVLVALSAPLIPKIRASRIAGAALDGINVASLALMVLVTWQLARSALVDWITIVLALLSAAVLFRFPRLNSAWLIAAGGLVGVVRYAAT
ncbi:MAG TPA: chromate efflux transporter [Gemmataceae bacterium]